MKLNPGPIRVYVLESYWYESEVQNSHWISRGPAALVEQLTWNGTYCIIWQASVPDIRDPVLVHRDSVTKFPLRPRYGKKFKEQRYRPLRKTTWMPRPTNKNNSYGIDDPTVCGQWSCSVVSYLWHRIVIDSEQVALIRMLKGLADISGQHMPPEIV